MRIRPKLVRGFIWDFDGPLAMSFWAGIRLLGDLARARGYAFTMQTIRVLVRNWGRKGDLLLQIAFEIPTIEEAADLYREWSELEKHQPYKLVPGAHETLAEICARGGINTILTSRPEWSFELSFDKMDIRQYFTHIVPTCRADFHKPHRRSLDCTMDLMASHGIPENQCTMIGDTFIDADTMRNRNILGFLVKDGGPYSCITQRPFGKARILPSSAHLLPRLEQLGYAVGA